MSTCPHIRGEGETHWCELAEKTAGELETLRAKIAAMEMALKGSADQRETALRQLEDATVEMLRLQADNQRLSESIIANSATYESERFALKSEIKKLCEDCAKRREVENQYCDECKAKEQEGV